jgi:rare lipoprotein A
MVRINDRGPYAGGRILDLSFAAARELDMINKGTAPIEIYLPKDRPISGKAL